jgi:hypothetical protein
MFLKSVLVQLAHSPRFSIELKTEALTLNKPARKTNVYKPVGILSCLD